MSDSRVVLYKFPEVKKPYFFSSGFLDVIRENQSFPSEQQQLVDGSPLGLEIFLWEHNHSGGGKLLKLKPSIKKQKCFREPPAF